MKYSALLVQSLRFGIAGIIAASTLLGTLFLFTEFFGWWYLASVVVANIVTIIVNFSVQKFFVFRSVERGVARKQFIKFIILSLGYLLINTILMYSLVSIAGWQYMYAQTFNAIVLAALTFYIGRRYIFAQ